VQRRHQKVIEEAPSAIVDEDLRQRMGAVAVQAAKSAGYTNAGTVEFLVDAERNFYFLEMNTRLQVEHPVTELVTGLDLVHLQLRIASGEKLPFQQEDVTLRGHAIECRIYAEDPDNNFFPSPGKIQRLVRPSGPGVREDSGVYEGWNVPLDYDPMLSKLIAFAPDRAMAIARMQRALDEYFVGGIKTNLGLFRKILQHPDFVAAKIDTGFLDRLLSQPAAPSQAVDEKQDVAAIAAALFTAIQASKSNGTKPSIYSPDELPANTAWKQAARKESVGGK
jgi:acetyl-CoA carboxylase biotin carboxylase subunit